MQTRSLGPFTVTAIGLGAMPMSSNNDNEIPEESQSIATIHAALDAGITLIDTADIYAPSWDTMGHNEELVAKALKKYGGDTGDVVVATKGGITRHEGNTFGRDGSLSYLRSAVENSLRRLGVDVIDLYQWHRPDRWQVYGEVIGHFKTLQDEGKIKAIGISNANVEEIEVAIEVLGRGVRSGARVVGDGRSASASQCSARSPAATASVRNKWCWPGSYRSGLT